MKTLDAAIAEIPQTDPRAEYLACRAEIDDAMRRVLEGGRYMLGDEVRAFEREFAAYLGANHAVGVASGTDAVELALRACGVGPGDEVLTVSMTAVATVAAIEGSGARAVLVDVDPRLFTLAPEGLASAVTARTKAIVVVHLYGQLADMGAIMEFARAHQLFVVEDCAQCHGAAFRAKSSLGARKAGTCGDIAAFSFYPTKNLGCIGDGGCVVTSSGSLAECVRLYREYGWRQRFVSAVVGGNSRLDEIQAAILRVKLRRLDVWNEERRRVAAIYDEELADTGVILPACASDREHVYHQYVVRAQGRDRLREALAAEGIGTGVHYPVPVHRQPAYFRLADRADLSVTEKLSGEILSLPMFPSLSDDDARHVAAMVRKHVP